MDIHIVLLSLIPAAITAAVSITGIVVSYLKDKAKRSDEAWEAAKSVLVSKADSDFLTHFDAEQAVEYFHALYTGLQAVERGEYDSYLQEIQKSREQPSSSPDCH